jgi:uncharacterized repeat protein (TIGR01451 family)
LHVASGTAYSFVCDTIIGIQITNDPQLQDNFSAGEKMNTDTRSPEFRKGLRIARIAIVAVVTITGLLVGLGALARVAAPAAVPCGATYTLQSTGSNWTSATWSGGPDPYPGATTTNDCASILGGQSVVLTSALPNPIAALTINNPMSVGPNSVVDVQTGGSLTLTGTSTLTGFGPSLGQLKVSGGTVTIASGAALNINGYGELFVGAPGSVANSGLVTVNPGGDIAMNGGTFDNSATVTMASTSSGPAGTLNWGGGTIQNTGTLVTDGASVTKGLINMGGASAAMTLSQQTITNNGRIVYSSPTNLLTMANSAAINITSGGQMSLNSTSNAPIADGGAGTNLITVAAGGTLTCSNPTASVINVPVNNAGTVSASGGTLNLRGGGTHTGSFQTSSTTDLINFAGGTHTWSTGTTFPSPFEHIGIIGGATVNDTVTVTIPTLSVSSGQLNLASGVTLTATTLSQSAGTTITGPGTLAAGSFTWSGGTQNGGGKTTVASSFSTSGSAALDGSRVLEFLSGTAPTATSVSTPLLSSAGTGVVQIDTGVTLTSTGANTMTAQLSNPGGSVNVSGGTLTLNAPAAFAGPITLAAGTTLFLQGITSTFNAGASVTGTGALVVNGSTVTLNTGITPPTAELASGQISGPGTFQPTNFVWSAGVLGANGDGGQVVIPPTGSVTLSPGVAAYLAHPFTNNGTVTWTGFGTLYIDYGTTFNNAGTFDAQANWLVTCGTGCGSSTFNNSGTFKKTTGVGTTNVTSAITFNNTGTVDAQTGTIQLPGGTSTGTFNTTNSPATTMIDFRAGTHTFNASASFTGTGTASFSGALAVLGTTISPPNASVSAGTVKGAGNFSPTNLTWSGGTIGATGDTGNLTIPVGGTVALSGSPNLNTRPFNNSGTVTWTGNGTFSLDNNATLNNLSGAMFDAQGNGVITCSTTCAASPINNSGTFQKTVASGTTTINNSVLVTNNGTLSGQAGILSLNGGSTTGGTVTTTSTGAIQFAGGTNTLSAGSTVNGSGMIGFSGGTAMIGGSYSPTGTTAISNATATFNTNATTGLINQTSGTLAGTGSFNIANGGTLAGGNVAVSGGLVLNAGALVMTGSGGTTVISTPFTILSGATVDFMSATNSLTLANVANNGSFVVNSGANIAASGTPTFTNAGNFTQASTTSTSFAPAFVNAGGAALFLGGTTTFSGGYTQSSGSTQLLGGNISSPSTVQINGGLLAGAGTLGGNLSNAGTINVGPSPVASGVLNITGSYTQTPTGALNLKITGPTAGTQYDQLIIGGIASLAGALGVTGSYTPTSTDSFTIMSFASKSGDFASKTFPSAAYRASYLPTAAPTSLVLAAPVFDLSATQSSSTTAVNGQNAVVTISVANAGPSAVDAKLSGTFSGPASFVSITGTAGATCTNSGSTFTCTWASLAATGTTPATVTLTLATTGTGTITTNASVTSTYSPDSNLPNDAATPLNISVTPSVNLGVTVTGTPTSVAAGGSVTYTVAVTNTGLDSSTASDPITLTLTGGTIASAAGAFTCSNSPTSASCTMPSIIGSGGTSSMTLTATAGTGASMSLSATASDANDTATPNNTASATTTITASATSDLTVAITHSPDPVPVGNTVTYTVKVSNLGPGVAASYSLSITRTGGTISSIIGTGLSCSTTTTSASCSGGSLPSGSFATATVVVVVSATNSSLSAAVTSPTDPNNSNNSASDTVNVLLSTDLTISKSGPASAGFGDTIQYTIVVGNSGPLAAANVVLTDATPAGLTLVSVTGSCLALPCSLGMMAAGGSAAVTAVYTVSSGAPATISNTALVSSSPGDSNPANNTATVTTLITGCNASLPQLIAPIGGAHVSSPVVFSWTAVTGATQYEVFQSTAAASVRLGIVTAPTTTLTASVPTGPLAWYVVATVPNCGRVQSATATANACNAPLAPTPGVVANAASGQTYRVEWPPLPDAATYEIQESRDEAFTSPTTQGLSQTGVNFTHTESSAPGAYFYRVRAVAVCDPQVKGPYSFTVRVVIVPLVPGAAPSANVPAGSTQVVIQEVFIPGLPDGNYLYAATVDKPWLSIDLPNGTLTPAGITLKILANPTTLPNGTFTGTLVLVLTPVSTSGSAARVEGSTTISVPVSVNLVTPVTPTKKTTTAANVLIIPSVGHLDGINSRWQSDIRLANVGLTKQQYALTFTPSSSSMNADAATVKQTTITVDAGATTALDDVARNWYGVGSMGEAANGVLEIHPLTAGGSDIAHGSAGTTPGVSLTTVASSRTYNVSSTGTLGQYIPALPLSGFVGRAADGTIGTVLSLQQVAQSAAYRTNIGIVEGAGSPAAVTLTVYDATGKKLTDFAVTLNAYQQVQLNSFLTTQGITLDDGRVEVKVTSGNGKVTAYASVIDNRTNDPLLVSGVPVGQTLASRYVLPGVAALNDGGANWQSDVRIFNSGTATQTATLSLYPLDGGTPLTASTTIDPNQVRSLDGIVQSVFKQSNLGGALHVTTAADSSLVVTGRTYNQTATGTYGQFIPAVTAIDAVGVSDRALHVLQVEDSPRYRTNFGVAEVTGNAATVRIMVYLPDSKVTPKIDIPLAAYEYRQFPIIQSMGLGNTYNARISVQVIDGTGKITAYGSIVDQATQDPTYVPAQ